jgi:predicted transcriptional regulator
MRRATVYLDDDLHKALRIKSMETDSTISEIVNEAVRVALQEDREDLAVAEERKGEAAVSYADFLKELKDRGQI